MDKDYHLMYEGSISYSHILQTPPCNVAHGHNAKVRIEIKSPSVDEKTGMIVNFHELKNILKQYDHRMILNDIHVLEIKKENEKVVYVYEVLDILSSETEKTYSIPEGDVKFLHLVEPTVENLAQSIYDDIRILNPDNPGVKITGIYIGAKLWRVKVTIWEQDYANVSYGDW